MFKINKRTVEKFCIIALEGKLVTGEAYKLEEEIAAQENNTHYRIVFDLTKLEYCSSYGLRIFINEQNKAKKHEGMSVLFNPGRNFKELLEIAGLEDFFNIKYSLTDLFKEL